MTTTKPQMSLLVVFIVAVVACSTTTAAAFIHSSLPSLSSSVPSSSSSSLLYSSRSSSSTSSSSTSSSSGSYNRGGGGEDLHAIVHRKEYEAKQLNEKHSKSTDPVRMAMGYHVDVSSIDDQRYDQPLRLAKALRRVHDDISNPANPKYDKNNPNGLDEKDLLHLNRKHDDENDVDEETKRRRARLQELGMKEVHSGMMRSGSFVVDIKRKSPSNNAIMAKFDDASMVAEAMVRLGADVVLINTDGPTYGGNILELRNAVQAVRKISNTAAVVMKDFIVDDIQLGLAKDAGADGVYLMASVLGPQLHHTVDLATMIGLEIIVECHTKSEVSHCLDLMVQNIMITNYDRVYQTYYPDQAIQLAGMFPGSGGPIITLAGGGIDTPERMKKHLAVGYDAVVVGKAIMGNAKAPEFIETVRSRKLLPAEMSQWGLDDYEFDQDGHIIKSPERYDTSQMKGDFPDFSSAIAANKKKKNNNNNNNRPRRNKFGLLP